jgi:hypothetical protein
MRRREFIKVIGGVAAAPGASKRGLSLVGCTINTDGFDFR